MSDSLSLGTASGSVSEAAQPDNPAASSGAGKQIGKMMRCYLGARRREARDARGDQESDLASQRHQSADALNRLGSAFIFVPDISSVSDRLLLAREWELRYVGSLPLDPPDNGFQVAPVETEQDRQEAMEVLARTHGLTDDVIQQAFKAPLGTLKSVKVFLARNGATAVATMVTSRVGQAVGIRAMGTLPKYARTTAGHALLRGVMAYHVGRGASSFFLGSKSTPQH
jgi:hypothetical protein